MLSHLLICIYHCKLTGVKPVTQVLKTKIRAIHNIEGIIAFRRIIYMYTIPKNGKNQTTFKHDLNTISIIIESVIIQQPLKKKIF